jgi:FkbM family methyltransferase
VSARGDTWWRVYHVLSRALALANRVPIGQRSVSIGGHKLYADSVDRLLALVSWKLGIGERKERALIERVVQPGMIVVDVGANVGLHTLGLASRVGPEGRVHALEPDPENFELLAKGVKHALFTNVRLHQAAAADKKGTLTLYVSAANRGDHRTVPAAKTRQSFEVSSVALDELLAEEPRVDFVKIDVQGAEVSVLRGLRETIRRSPGIGILCELCPEQLLRAGTSAQELFLYLEEGGLAAHRILATGETEPIAKEAVNEEAERSGYLNIFFTTASGS